MANETAWLIELRGAHPPWYWHAEPDMRALGGFDPDVNKAMRFCREKDARAMALMLGAKGMIAITDVRHIEITEHAWIDPIGHTRAECRDIVRCIYHSQSDAATSGGGVKP